MWCLKMRNKVYHIVSEMFGILLREIDDNTSAKDISGWDSLAHLNLVLALEATFGVDLSPEDISGMLTVGSIITTLMKYDLS